MDNYSEYLKYLKHVDDTTLNDFKVREQELRNELNSQKTRCEDRISAINRQHGDEIQRITRQKEEELNRTNKNHADEKSRILAEAASSEKRLKDEHERIMADLCSRFDAERNQKNAELEKANGENSSLNSSLVDCRKELENTRSNLEVEIHRANLFETNYNTMRARVNELKIIRLVSVIILSFASFGILLLAYGIYVIVCLFGHKKYFSLIRWIRCDKYISCVKESKQ